MKKMDRHYIPGDRWVTCNVCDFGYRFSQMRRGITGKQKGLVVCPDCFDEISLTEQTYSNTTEGKLQEVK